jgi:glucokinase
MISLAADIGGTFSRLAWFGAHDASATEQVFTNAEFACLEDVIAQGLTQLDRRAEPVSSMVLALPGPARDDPVRLTNIDWLVSRDALKRRFGVKTITIVNDFQAAALGAINEPREHLKPLNSATPADGPVVVAGAGTGLGMAWLGAREQRALPQATEGGHIDFAPTNPDQVALYLALAERYGHVSYERILSGGGLVDTYRHFAGADVRGETPAQVAAMALDGDDAAVAAIRCFVDVFAAYAGNLALAFNPGGGIFLCGGLTAHLADWFEPDAFSRTFADKGRMTDLVRRIPVYLVTRAQSGLAGALRIARAGQVSPWA